MSDIPTDLGYRESHEWVRAVGDGTAVIGISDHAQSALGDMVFVELPEPGLSYEQGDACAVVESVKAASDVYTPLAGTVIEANETLADSPEAVNQDAYGAGWLMKLKPASSDALNDLMDPDAYQAFIDAE